MSGADFSLQGKVAVVTGAAGLLGRQHVRALAGAGAMVVALDRDQRALAEVAGPGEGDRVRPFLGDVTDPQSIERLRGVVYRELGQLDILVNNAALDDKVEAGAGNGVEAGLEYYPLDRWRQMLDINVTGVFLPCQVLGTAMAAAGGGSIINIASTYGLVAPDPALYRRPDGSRPFVKSPAYPASKGAVIALTRYFAAYWGDRGVRVNALAPGGVENGQDSSFIHNYSRRTPLGRMAAADEYQGALIYLASDASSYTTGATLVVDGGFTAW
jgi:NAD(P)-dependent dehydrogenase (short-subunit alcohol dehydrogenase family)